MSKNNQQVNPEVGFNTTPEPPQNELETKLLQLWQKVLDVDQIGVQDDFFEFGGDSFKAVNLLGQIGKNLTLIDFYQNPTVRQLANRL